MRPREWTLGWILISVVFAGGNSPLQAIAAPCCSAGSVLPSLITGDDQGQFTASFSRSEVAMDAPAQGLSILRAPESQDWSVSSRLTVAWRLADRLQIGVGTTYVRRKLQVQARQFESSGLSDSDLSLAFEALPEWTYSVWRPKGFAFIEMVLPTGKAVQQGDLRNPSETRGQGVFQIVMGSAVLKQFGHWDAYVIPEVRWLAPRAFANGTRLGGGSGGSVTLGAGWSPGGKGLRLGTRLQPVIQSDREVATGAYSGRAAGRRVWNASLEAAYLIEEEWMSAFTYTDQTFVGPAENTVLERTFTLALQRRWQP